MEQARKKEKVSKEILNKIKNNYIISPHAKQRLKERVRLLYGNTDINKFVYNVLKSKEKDAIYTYQKRRVSVKKNKGSSDYLIFDYDEKMDKWILVSYVSLVKEF